MRYAMLIDQKRCIGCNNCAVTCKNVNNLPNNTWWNVIQTTGGEHPDTPAGEYPDNLSMSFLPKACQHCVNPPCVAVCPAGATYRREDGIVMMDYETCIGCKLCIDACPYDARTFNDEEPTYSVDFALGDADIAPHVQNVAEKCVFCYQRIDRGEIPACMELCPTRARVWGDLDDPESEISQRMAGREVISLLEEEGTGPSTIYLN